MRKKIRVFTVIMIVVKSLYDLISKGKALWLIWTTFNTVKGKLQDHWIKAFVKELFCEILRPISDLKEIFIVLDSCSQIDSWKEMCVLMYGLVFVWRLTGLWFKYYQFRVWYNFKNHDEIKSFLLRSNLQMFTLLEVTF